MVGDWQAALVVNHLAMLARNQPVMLVEDLPTVSVAVADQER